MSQLKVFGHIAPDTDATCSPIVYAWFLSEKMNMDATAFILGEPNKEAQFVIERFGLELPEIIEDVAAGDQVVILDTNNPEELPASINDTEIVEIIDHHKLAGGLKTESPLRITMKPIACTATLVWQRIQEEGHTVPENIAGTLLACILSDTLKFTSPTTTDVDKEAAKELAEISGEDIDALAEAMFAAKSDLTGMSDEDILLSDSKVFEMGSKKVRVSVLETTKPENALEMREQLIATMKTMKEDQNLDHMFFFVVDILNTAANLVVETDEEMAAAKEAFSGEFEDGSMYLEGVVSRKKQMVPNLEGVLK